MLRKDTIDFLDRLESAQTLEAVWDVSLAHFRRSGLTHTIYMYVDTRSPSATQVLTSLPPSWTDHYLEQHYDLVDPFLRYCCRSFQPIATGGDYVDSYDYLNGTERRIILEGGETGFRSGFTSPVGLLGERGFGGWNFGSSLRRREFEALAAELADTVRLDGFFVHEHLQRTIGTGWREASARRLTDRERECLLWLARGLRTGQIAELLGLAEITVAMHIKGARTKLGARTREQAVARAMLAGEICP